MSNFNSDLNNLFSNWQKQQKYNQYTKASTKDKKDISLWGDIDLNKDGKITSADKTKMTNEATTLKKNKNLFDVNGDGFFNQADIDMFVKGDVNGDGEITQEELNFVSAYKKDLTTVFTKQKADFEIDGKKYENGEFATGVYDGKYYNNGVLSDGTVSGKKYVEGFLANGVISGKLYRDGVKLTGLSEDGKYYNEGKLANKVVVDGKYCLNGIPSSGTYNGKLYDENGLANGLVTQTEDKKEVTYMYKDGIKLTGISENDSKYYRDGLPKTGTSIIKEDGKNVSYYFIDGEKAQGIVKIGSSNYMYKDGVRLTGLSENGLYYQNGLLKSGTVTEGKTKTKYSKGVLKYSVTNNYEKNYPKESEGTIIFSSKIRVKLDNGDKAVINEDGTVSIASKDDKTILYTSKGSLANGVINGVAYKDGEKTYPIISGNTINFENGKRYILQNGDKAVINAMGNIEITRILYSYKSGYVTEEYDKDFNCIRSITEVINWNNEKSIMNTYYEYCNKKLIKERSEYTNLDYANDKYNIVESGVINYTYKNEKISSYKKSIYNYKNGDLETIYELNDLEYLNNDTITYLIEHDNNNIIITDRIKTDIEIVKTAEKVGAKGSKEYNASIKSQMISTPNNMKNEVGEIVEKEDGLYVNDGNGLVKLNISADTYLKLFPPIERYDINQKNIGDCYFVSGCLIDMMKNPKAFSQLIQMFSENEKGDISIKFAGTLSNYSPIIFENSELKVIDGKVDEKRVTHYLQTKGAIGIQMLEQAYAISRFVKDSNQEISAIDIDAAIPTIIGGFQAVVYEQVLDINNIDSFSMSDILPRYCPKFPNEITDDINNDKILFSLGFYKSIYEYDIHYAHAYSLEKIDTENKIIYITNPWYGGCTIAVPFYLIAEIRDNIIVQIAYL